MKSPYLECGVIVAPHGVRGAVKIESWCDSPRDLASLPRVFFLEPDGSYTERKLLNPSVYKGQVMTTLAGCCSMDEAILFKGKTVYAARADLPVKEGRILLADLIGLPVIDIDSGRVYGTLREITPSPASDLYTVDTGHGDVFLPAVPEFIKERDAERGILVRVIPGFFDDEV